jgi:putative NADH-flavin reductase
MRDTMNTNSITVALIGATGKAGNVILSELLSYGYKVKVLVRTISSLKVINNNALQVIIGNATNDMNIKELLSGCDVVVNACSNRGNDHPISYEVTSNIIDVINQDKSIRYFVVTGKTLKTENDMFSLKTYFERMYLKRKYPAIIASKEEEYRALKKSIINWTIIRCPMICDSTNEHYIASIHKCKGKQISKTNIAKFINEEINKKNFVLKAPYLFDC